MHGLWAWTPFCQVVEARKKEHKDWLFGLGDRRVGWGSSTRISRRCLERPLGEYAPLGVRPKFATKWYIFHVVTCTPPPLWDPSEFPPPPPGPLSSPSRNGCHLSNWRFYSRTKHFFWAHNVLSCVSKRKEAPNIKNLQGSRVPWGGGGLGGGVSGKILCIYAFFRGLNNGSEVPQGQNRQTNNLARRWVESRFFVIGCKWPQIGSKVGFDFFFKKSAPKTYFGSTLGPLPANDEKPTFDSHLCQTILLSRKQCLICCGPCCHRWLTLWNWMRSAQILLTVAPWGSFERDISVIQSSEP